MKKAVLILFVLLVSANFCTSAIAPTQYPYKTTKKDGNINPDALKQTGIKKVNTQGLIDSLVTPIQDSREALKATLGYSLTRLRGEGVQFRAQKEAERKRSEENTSSLWGDILYFCIAMSIVLFLVGWLTICLFRIVNRILNKIDKTYNKIKTKSDNALGKIKNGFSGSKEKVLQRLSDKNTGGTGLDLKHLGFDFYKKSWIKAGVIRTLEQTGLDIKFTRHIANSLDSIGQDFWNIVLDCTKSLNNQCVNVLSSLISLELYKLIYCHDIKTKNSLPLINDILDQLNDAIDYQSNMGHEKEINEAKRRFEYIKSRFLHENKQTTYG